MWEKEIAEISKHRRRTRTRSPRSTGRCSDRRATAPDGCNDEQQEIVDGTYSCCFHSVRGRLAMIMMLIATASCGQLVRRNSVKNKNVSECTPTDRLSSFRTSWNNYMLQFLFLTADAQFDLRSGGLLFNLVHVLQLCTTTYKLNPIFRNRQHCYISWERTFWNDRSWYDGQR